MVLVTRLLQISMPVLRCVLPCILQPSGYDRLFPSYFRFSTSFIQHLMQYTLNVQWLAYHSRHRNPLRSERSNDGIPVGANFLCTPRPTPCLTLLPVQWTRGQSGDYSPPSSVDVANGLDLYLCLQWRVMACLHIYTLEVLRATPNKTQNKSD